MNSPLVYIKENLYYHIDLNVIFRLEEDPIDLFSLRTKYIDKFLNIQLCIPTTLNLYLILDNNLSSKLSDGTNSNISKVVSNQRIKEDPYSEKDLASIEDLIAFRFSCRVKHIFDTCYLDNPKVYITYRKDKQIVFTIVGRVVGGFLATSVLLTDYEVFVPDEVISSEHPLDLFSKVSYENMTVIKEKLDAKY